MKIVVLDGYTLNPGDLSWDGFKGVAETIVYERTMVHEIIDRAAGAEILLTNKTPLGEAEFSKLPHLKYVGVLATGYNIVDIEAAKKRNIIVTNIPAYGTNSVAQMTFALLLELCHRVQNHSDAVKSGAWSQGKDFCFWNHPLKELDGKTLGVIGFGRIGQQVAKIAAAFGMKVIAFDRNKNNQPESANFKWSDLEHLLMESDVISLHCPLFPETKEIINKSTLRKMKKTAFIINTSRGPLIAEEDLAQALNDELIAGAALDVLSVEPPSNDNPLMKAKNCIITPHISWATREAREKLMHIAVGNVKAFINSEPVNVVV